MRKPGSRHSQGMSIIEVALVVAISGIMAATAAPLLSDTLARRTAEAAAVAVIDTVREAQFSTMSGRHDAAYGVHFASDRMVLFRGAVYVPADPDNFERTMPAGASVTVDFGGGDDLHFPNRRGLPTETGTITVTGNDGTAHVVTVGAGGTVESD